MMTDQSPVVIRSLTAS